MAGKKGSSPLARGLRKLIRDADGTVRIIPARAGFTDPVLHRRAREWDHPRSRGVYPRVAAIQARMAGSSPLARGLRDSPRARFRFGRIIPARAGFTVLSGDGPVRVWDHPRSRGVYEVWRPSQTVPKGSSSLARGLPEAAINENGDIRIIPARAGFTSTRLDHRTRPTDHPRSRGVYITRGCPRGLFPGSSPLARGLLSRSR